MSSLLRKMTSKHIFTLFYGVVSTKSKVLVLPIIRSISNFQGLLFSELNYSLENWRKISFRFRALKLTSGGYHATK